MGSYMQLPAEHELKHFRPMPFYFITTTEEKDLCYEAVYDSLKKLKEDGFGGLILFNKPESGFNSEQYLTTAWFDMVKTFIRASEELDLKLWVNDGFNFPPGDVGGRINKEKYPELTPLRLTRENGKISATEVPWGFPAFELPKTSELFHEIVYEAYLREVGEHFGKTFQGFFSDADNRRVSYRVFQPDFPVKEYYPWSSNFEETFEKSFGYDISPYLGDVLDKKDSRQVADYWQHAGELYQSWFRSNYEWCNAHGLKYSFHTSDTAPFPMEVAPRSSAFTEGRAITMEKNSDYPGTDQELMEINGGRHMRQDDYWVPKSTWGGDDSFAVNPDYRNVVSDLRTKQAASSAFLYDKKGVLCEMFAASNWGATPQNLREIAAWQIMQGVTVIVPHAYHHRFLGWLKYFAPPDFSRHSHLNIAVRELNDMMAYCAYFASRGQYDTKVAVLDLTEDIWTGYQDTETYFRLCAALNRLPYGYIIAGLCEIRENRDKFSVLINAGRPLSPEITEELEGYGITVLSAGEIERLAELVGSDVAYTGEGTPHFMSRLLDNGEKLILLANIEDGKPINGTLSIGNRSFAVSLESGEIAIFTNEGQLRYDEKPVAEGEKTVLNGSVPVVWTKQNSIPLDFWKNEKGNAVTKNSPDKEKTFTFSVNGSTVRDTAIVVSRTALQSIASISLNGKALCASSETTFGDEICDVFPFSCKEPGEYHLTLTLTGTINNYEPMYLVGDFNADVKISNPFYAIVDYQYSLNRHIPADAVITLSKRTTELAAGQNWCQSGHPFYSGGATYRFKTKLPDKYSKAVLKAEGVRDILLVSVDGKTPKKCIFEPYRIDLGDMSGEHTLDITVYNTNANSLEGYQAPSGLLGDLIIQAK